MAVYTAIDDPEAYFQAQLYTGNGSTQSITLDGETDMQPDFVWLKARSAADAPHVFDSVRGVEKRLLPDGTNAEATMTGGLSAFNSDGFSLGSNTAINDNTTTFVGWNWKANGSGSANTVGSIASTVSVNTTSGFSIVTWTSTGSTGTVGHGLGVVPKFIVVKRLVDSGYDWVVYHVDDTAGLYLNEQGVNNDSSAANIFGRNPTTTVFDITADGRIGGNTTGDTYVAYCFADVAGYSKFGSYIGNSSADGPFIYTGFRPAYVMVKRIDDVSDYQIQDSKRIGYNVNNYRLNANTAAVEATSGVMDFVSNGFKFRGTPMNTTGGTFIYWAFAEAPFANSNGVPCNAR